MNPLTATISTPMRRHLSERGLHTETLISAASLRQLRSPLFTRI
jgi:hypothetical protein